MFNIDAGACRLRALEPSDVELMYIMENDPEVWRVSGTLAPISRERLVHFIEEQNYDIYATKQMRLAVDVEGVMVGSVDIFDFDPLNCRFGVGVIIYGADCRRRGYARMAIEAVKIYARETLFVKQIWAGVAADNAASLALFEACGFEMCGRRREWLRRANGYVDEVEFQCLL
jgi:diamine N-acetyltransferase